MQNIYLLTDAAILSKMGERIKAMRLEQNMSQRALATASGVSLGSVSYIENGQNANLMTLISILRALHALEMLDDFMREPEISPIEYAKMMENQKQRQRASHQTQQPTKTESEW